MNVKLLEQEELVLRAQAGDRAAFGELVERFQPIVLAAARARQRDRHEADELAQEVFLHAMRKIGQLRDPACLAGWLRKITLRVAINRGKRRGLVVAAESEVLQQHADRGAGPVEDLVKSEQRDRVREAVAGLRPIDRDALAAFYLRGKSLMQIADELDVPLGTVKRRLHVARQRLQVAYEAREEGGSAGRNEDGRSETPRLLKRRIRSAQAAGVVLARRGRPRDAGSAPIAGSRPELMASETVGPKRDRAASGDGPRPATPVRKPRIADRAALAVA